MNLFYRALPARPLWGRGRIAEAAAEPQRLGTGRLLLIRAIRQAPAEEKFAKTADIAIPNPYPPTWPLKCVAIKSLPDDAHHVRRPNHHSPTED